MKLTVEHNDDAVLAELGERLSRVRLNRNQTQAALAADAGVSKRTIERIEAGQSTQLANLIRVLRALQLLDNVDRLVPPPAPSPIEQLKLRGKVRERASRRTADDATAGDWSWDDDT